MYCPKCRKPLFEPDKCRYCDWTKAEVQPEVPAPVAPEPVRSKSYPMYYHILSWLTVGLILLIGYSQFSSKNSDIGTYKAIITCLSALIFIPQISVGDKEKPLIIYAFKWIVALCVIVFV